MHNSNSASQKPFEFGIELTPDRPVGDIAQLAAVAEGVGIDAVFVSNHFDNRDPFLTLAAIGERTDRLSLGPGVVNPIETHPVRLATQTATLAEQFPGRVVCGLGAGDRSTLAKLALDADRPVRRVAEAVHVVRELTAGEAVDTGPAFDLTDVSLSYAPGTVPVPVFVGAQGPTMLRMASELADGILLNGSTPADVRAAAGPVAVGQQRREDARDPVRVVGFPCVSVADSVGAAREAARAPVAFVTAGAPTALIDRHGLHPDRVATVRDSLSTGDHAAAYRAVTPGMLDAFSVAGTVEDVTGGLRSLTGHVDALVVGAPLGPDRERAIELLGEVASPLREERVVGG